MSLQNKVVVVTGSGTGIGAAAAHGFRNAGAKVVLNGRRETVLSKTASGIDASGENVAFVAGDIGEPETSRKLVATAIKRFGGVDILINNAGVFRPKPFLEHTQDDLNGYFNLMRGYFMMSQAAIAEMQKRGGGAIVSIGSM